MLVWGFMVHGALGCKGNFQHAAGKSFFKSPKNFNDMLWVPLITIQKPNITQFPFHVPCSFPFDSPLLGGNMRGLPWEKHPIRHEAISMRFYG